MKKTIQVLIAAAITFTLTACTRTGEVNSAISDPFAALSDNGETNTTNDEIAMIFKELEAYSEGGFALTINNNNMTIYYDGEPIKITIDIDMFGGNEINWSIGVPVFINGLAQEVSADGVNYSYMAVYSDLEPGKKYQRELWLKPSVLLEDRGKDKLNVSFTECANVHYSPNAVCPRLNGTHRFFDYRIVLEMQINREITSVVEADIETIVRDKIPENSEKGVSYIMPNKDGSNDIYYLNEDGTLSGTFILQNTDSGKHRLAVFMNDEPVTFNGGKRFVDVEFKEGHNYLFDFVLDEKPKALDFFYVLDFYDIQQNENKVSRLGSDTPSIIVECDYIDPLS